MCSGRLNECHMRWICVGAIRTGMEHWDPWEEEYHSSMGLKCLYKLRQIWRSLYMSANGSIRMSVASFEANMDAGPFADVACGESSVL